MRMAIPKAIFLTDEYGVYPSRVLAEAHLIIGSSGQVIKDRQGRAGVAASSAAKAEATMLTPKAASHFQDNLRTEADLALAGAYPIAVPGPKFEIGQKVHLGPDDDSEVCVIEKRSWIEFRDNPAHWRYLVRQSDGGTNSRPQDCFFPVEGVPSPRFAIGQRVRLRPPSEARVGKVIKQNWVEADQQISSGSGHWRCVVRWIDDDGRNQSQRQERDFIPVGDSEAEDPPDWHGTEPAKDIRELRIVLEDISDPDSPPDYLFIGIEDQNGKRVGFPIELGPAAVRPRIVIPYGRDDAWVSEVAYQAAGAAICTVEEGHPYCVSSVEAVREAVGELLSEFGIPLSAASDMEDREEPDEDREDAPVAAATKGPITDITKEPGEEAPVGDVSDTDESYEDHLLRQREEARASEDLYKTQRNLAFLLLRHLIGDLIPPAGGGD